MWLASALIAQYLDDNDISQAEFADSIGSGRSRVFYLFRGSRPRDAQTRKRIARFTKGFVPVSSWDQKTDRTRN